MFVTQVVGKEMLLISFVITTVHTPVVVFIHVLVLDMLLDLSVHLVVPSLACLSIFLSPESLLFLLVEGASASSCGASCAVCISLSTEYIAVWLFSDAFEKTCLTIGSLDPFPSLSHKTLALERRETSSLTPSLNVSLGSLVAQK